MASSLTHTRLCISWLLLAALLFPLAQAYAQTVLTEVPTDFPGVDKATLAWGDYDSDGDLDLFLVGEISRSTSTAHIYRNDSGSFVDLGISFERPRSGSWADYDNDGDLDLLVTGKLTLYENQNGTFTPVDVGLDGLTGVKSAWGDYDNDGDLDLALSFYVSFKSSRANLFRNDGGVFTRTSAVFAGIYHGDLAWADYDNNGYLDLLVSGTHDNGKDQQELLYLNTEGRFEETNVFSGYREPLGASPDWGDYDGDGDLDLLLPAHVTRYLYSTYLYVNESNTLTRRDLGLPASWHARVHSGDYDNDGDLDFALSGEDDDFKDHSYIVRNDGYTSFTITKSLPSLIKGDVQWGDYDSDGDLDLILTGYSQDGARATRLYRNDGTAPSTPPTAPSNLQTDQLEPYRVELSWGTATDDITPTASLSYNVRVGTAPGQSDVMSAQSITEGPHEGRRLIVGLGNMNQRRTLLLKNLTPGQTYYWSVQAIDQSHQGSRFATEQQFTTPGTTEPPSTRRFTMLEPLLSYETSPGDWGDYDGDGDYDFVQSYWAGTQEGTLIHRNEGAGVFTPLDMPFGGGARRDARWYDYDGDNDLDLHTGDEIYRNDGNDRFTLVQETITNAFWGDTDQNGSADLLTSSGIALQTEAETWRELVRGVPGSYVFAPADFNNDGKLDIFGVEERNSDHHLKIYAQTTPGRYKQYFSFPFPGDIAHAAWGDYDQDGDLDFVAGTKWTTPVFFQPNERGLYAYTPNTFPRADHSTWGDLEGDGDLDLLFIANNRVMGDGVLHVYANDGSGQLTEVEEELPYVPSSPLYVSSAASFEFTYFIDFDGDGDLDIATATGALARNDGAIGVNTPPTAPAGLETTLIDGSVTLAWQPSSDNETASPGLTYALRVGTTPGSGDVMPPQARPDGKRLLPGPGNAWHNNALTLQNLQAGTYYWSVQAIDPAGLSSPFAEEAVFTTNGLSLGDFEFVALNDRFTEPQLLDYDGDGDLDLLDNTENPKVFLNTDGEFTLVDLNLTLSGNQQWHDIDGDGDADVFDKSHRLFWINQSNHMFEAESVIGLGGVTALADYDGDGDFDVVGSTGTGFYAETHIWRNDGSFAFTKVASVDGTALSSTCAWQDVDKDGDLDILVRASQTGITVYRNDDSNYTAVETTIPNYSSIVSCIDYDNDGDRDMVLSFSTEGALYRNDPNATFTLVAEDLELAREFSWGDYDGDGDLDLFSFMPDGPRLYANDNDDFSLVSDVQMPEFTKGLVVWGDYDGDGDLDMAFSGVDQFGDMVQGLLRNHVATTNAAPQAPTNLQASTHQDTATLTWEAATDAETPVAGLVYEVRVGTASGASDVVSSLRTAQSLPAGTSTIWETDFMVSSLLNGTYYWSVRAVDVQGAASPYATEGTFTITESDVRMFTAENMLSFDEIYTSDVGDYDGDGDLDIAVAAVEQDVPVTRIYRNDGDNAFTPLDLQLPTDGYYPYHWSATELYALSWNDYDNDNDLDLLVSGKLREERGIYLFRNDGNDTFVETVAHFPGLVGASSMSWGDYNSDGLVDLLMWVFPGDRSGYSQLYRNEGGTFAPIQVFYERGGVGWGDYDQDLDLDLVIGDKVYRNDSGAFNELGTFKSGNYYGRYAFWVDFDDDGDLDLYNNRWYRNDGDDVFVETDVALLADALRDYDGDGDLDLIGEGFYQRVDGTTLERMPPSLRPRRTGTTTQSIYAQRKWVDWDQDGHVDLLSQDVDGTLRVYMQRTSVAPLPAPTTPTNLQATLDRSRGLLSWEPNTPTLSQTRTYNVRVGTTPGGHDVVSAHVASTGRLLRPSYGNAYVASQVKLKGLRNGTYYWSVQAINDAFLPSDFAEEQQFTISDSDARIFRTAPVAFDPAPPNWIAYSRSKVLSTTDYDNDGDIDLLVVEQNESGAYEGVLYSQEDGTVSPSSFLGTRPLSASWGDVDQDGDLDLLITELILDLSSWVYTTRAALYIQQPDGSLTRHHESSFPRLYSTSALWADLDRNGKLDVIHVGLSLQSQTPKVYTSKQTNQLVFAEPDSSALSDLILRSSAQLVDYDSDQDDDLVVIGNLNGGLLAVIGIPNENGAFTRTVPLFTDAVDLPQWGDYDQDGDLDALLRTRSGAIHLHANNGKGSFSQLEYVFPKNLSYYWGDTDNDGDLDVVVDEGATLKIHRNKGNDTFEDTGFSYPLNEYSPMVVKDMDHDGDVDFLVQSSTDALVYLFNDGDRINTPPQPPTGLAHTLSTRRVQLSWEPGTDAETAAPALTYNLRVGTAPGANDVLFAPRLPLQRQPRGGNIGPQTGWMLNLAGGTYYWAVQSVDASGLASAYTTEQTFTLEDHTETLQLNYAAGWNMVGLPVAPTTMSQGVLFPDAIAGTLFDFTTHYQAQTNFAMGRGYWLRFANSASYTMTGDAYDALSVTLQEGWNLVSGPTCVVPLSAISDPNNVLVPATWYGFNDTYRRVDQLEPGRAYWVRARVSGSVSLSCTSSSKQGTAPELPDTHLNSFQTLVATSPSGMSRHLYFDGILPDSVNRSIYSLPPTGPAGTFDIRFADGYGLAEEDSVFGIVVQATAETMLALEGQQAYVVEGQRLKAPVLLSADKPLTLYESDVLTLRRASLAEASGLSTLNAVQLFPNYPNPFNPESIISYYLPQDESIRLAVYDGLGRLVRLLHDGMSSAGMHRYVFEAHDLPSGMYIYRLETQSGTFSRKMVLMK